MNEGGPYRLSRRRLIGAAGAALLVGSGVRASRAAPPVTSNPPFAPLRFDILAKGSVIGTHRVDFQRSGDDLLAETRIEIEAKLLLLTLFRYSHRAAETWRANRLEAFASTTDDDGRQDTVFGRARHDGFEVTGRKGTVLAPADVMVGSFWNPNILSRDLLIDPQKGTLKEQVVHGSDRTTLTIGGTPRPVTRYRLASVVDGVIFYDDEGRWVGGAFDKKGTNVRYRLQG